MPKKADKRRKYYPVRPRPKDKAKTGHDPIKPAETKQHNALPTHKLPELISATIEMMENLNQENMTNNTSKPIAIKTKNKGKNSKKITQSGKR